VRIAYFAPNLVLNGVYRWISDLAAHTDPSRITWTGGLIYGKGSADVHCVRSLSKLMPLHCGDPAYWGLVWHTREALRIHSTMAEAAAAAAEGADAVLTWESDTILDQFRFLGLPIILVSHSTWWAPEAIRNPATRRPLLATHLAAVSEQAAKPFQRQGHEVTVVHSGVSLDHCAPAHGRDAVRADWRAGPGHKLLLSIGRHDDRKQLSTAAKLVKELGPRYRAVICGGDENRQVTTAIQSLANDSNGQVLAVPPRERLGDLYHACDLLVSDSLHESFGQVLVEAWVAGLPTLCREGQGLVPEMERKFGPLAYKYHPQTKLPDVAAFAEQILNGKAEPGIVERARQVAQTYLSATAMAARWEDYLLGLGLERSAVTLAPREVRRRWRDPQRPLRVLLYCRRLDRELLDQVLCLPNAVCVGAVVTEEVLCQPPYTPVLTDATGPDWADRHADLRDGFLSQSRQADLVLVNDLPYAASAISLTTLPSLGWVRASDHYQGWEKQAAASLDRTVYTHAELWGEVEHFPPSAVSERMVSVFMICPHIGFGGTERWMESVFKGAGTHWVGCGSVTTEDPNPELSQQFEAMGIQISRGEEIAEAISIAKPDVVVFWGVEQVGRYFPPDYRGPIVSMSHGTKYCNWTRRWVESSASYATHRAAVSFAAIDSYPPQYRSDVEVIYPGTELPQTHYDRQQLRYDLGFAESDRVLVYVGRADPAKNPLLAADLVAALPRQYKLLHIGDVSEWPGDFKAELSQRLPGRFRYINHTARVPDLLHAADLLVLRSTAESVGLVLLEALWAGCDVLTSDRTILGELQTDLAWQGAGLVLPHNTAMPELVKAVTARFDGQPVDNSGCWAQLQRRFSSTVAADNFSRYLRHVAETSDGGGGVPLFAVSDRNPTPIGHEADSHVSCDAVLVLSEDHYANEVAAESLLGQRTATVFVHARGSAAACGRLRQRFPDNWQLQLEEVEAGGWVTCPVLDYAWELLHGKQFRSEYVLLTCPGSRSLPDRAAVTVGHMRSAGLELFVTSNNPLMFDSLAIRVGTLLDLLLCGNHQFADVAELFRVAKAGNRLRSIHPATLTTGRLTGEFCRRASPLVVMTPPVDVVLPFHDQFEYTRQAIESVLAQKSIRVVLHLIDGDSSDRAGADALLSRYRGQHGEIAVRTYRTKGDIGQFMAVNAVEQYLETDYLLIQDGDDISDPNRAFVSALSLCLSGAGLFSSAVRLFGGGPRMLLSSYPYDGCRYYVINPASAIRRSEFVRLGGYFSYGGAARDRCSLDTDFFLRAVASGVRCQVSSLSLVSYRQHPASAVMNSETGFRSEARRYVEQALVRNARLLPSVRGSLEACRGLLEQCD